jgi:hypothetical protein
VRDGQYHQNLVCVESENRVGKPSRRRGQHIAVRAMASPDACPIQGSRIDVMHKPTEPRLLISPLSSDHLPSYLSCITTTELPLTAASRSACHTTYTTHTTRNDVIYSGHIHVSL